MTKLETLYASIKGLQDLGLPLNEQTLNAADELEDQLRMRRAAVCDRER